MAKPLVFCGAQYCASLSGARDRGCELEISFAASLKYFSCSFLRRISASRCCLATAASRSLLITPILITAAAIITFQSTDVELLNYVINRRTGCNQKKKSLTDNHSFHQKRKYCSGTPGRIRPSARAKVTQAHLILALISSSRPLDGLRFLFTPLNINGGGERGPGTPLFIA